MALTSADRFIAAVKSETTYGTDAIAPGPPASYAAFRALGLTPVLNQIEAPRATWSASGEKSCSVKSHTDVTWEMPFTGRIGAAGTAGAWDALLMASGFKKTTSAGVSVSYKPNTINDNTDTPSATIWKYMRQLENAGAYLQKARGYRGNATIRLTVGEEAVISGTGQALYDPMTTAEITAPTAPSAYDGQTCMVVQRLVLTMGAVEYPAENVEFTTNWTITPINTGELGGGVVSKVVLTRPMSGGRVGVSFRLVDGGTAYAALVNAWQSGTLVTLSATLTDGTRTITITAPNVQYTGVATSAEAVLKYDVTGALNRGTTGDDELVITLT